MVWICDEARLVMYMRKLEPSSDEPGSDTMLGFQSSGCVCENKPLRAKWELELKRERSDEEQYELGQKQEI